MKKRMVVGLAFAMLAVGAHAVLAAEAAPRRVVVTDVTPAQVTARRFAVHLASRDTVSLSFPMTGKLGIRQARKDSEVKKGQILAQLEQEEFLQKVAKARSTFQRADESYQRMKAVPKGVSKDQLSAAESAQKVAAAELRIAEKNLADATIVAPFDGVVVATDGDPGQVIPGGSMVTRLHSHTVNVKLNVPETMICRADWKSRLSGPGIEVEVAACPGLRLPARFDTIDLTANNGAQVYLADYQIDTPPGYTFYEGMSATLYMPNAELKQKSLVDVPFDALCRRADGTSYVWAVVRGKDGRCTAVRRDVQVIHRNCTTAAVSGNLAVGEQVVILGTACLGEGVEISPVKGGR